MSSTVASTSDYKFQRSQRRPTGGSDEVRPKMDVFYDAVFNRLGEEVGQRLDKLIWPMVPESAKRLTGVIAGRVLPLLMAGKGAMKATSAAKDLWVLGSATQDVLDRELGQVLATVDGCQSKLEFKGLGYLPRLLRSARDSWKVSLQLAENRFVQVTLDDEPSSGRLEEWRDGAMIDERSEVSPQETHEHLAKFLSRAYVLELARRMGIDHSQSAQDLGEDRLRAFLVVATYVASSLKVEAS